MLIIYLFFFFLQCVVRDSRRFDSAGGAMAEPIQQHRCDVLRAGLGGVVCGVQRDIHAQV